MNKSKLYRIIPAVIVGKDLYEEMIQPLEAQQDKALSQIMYEIFLNLAKSAPSGYDFTRMGISFNSNGGWDVTYCGIKLGTIEQEIIEPSNIVVNNYRMLYKFIPIGSTDLT